MGSGRVIDVDGVRAFRIDGCSKFYAMLPKQEEVFQNGEWSLHLTMNSVDGRGRKNPGWANCRLYRLTGRPTVFHLGVFLRGGRLAKNSCVERLDRMFPGMTEWVLAATAAHNAGEEIVQPPADPPKASNGVADREPTREEEKAIADLVRERFEQQRPVSQHRAARTAWRYVGDIAEQELGIEEPIAFLATKRLIGMAVLDDLVTDSRSKQRSLRVIESAYAERFAALIEKEAADAQ